ncbi:hypothetical protein AAFN87_10040 [Solibacillus sp. CAU 1738]
MKPMIKIRGMLKVKQGDIIIYACVVIGAGIGLVLDQAFPGVLVGLGFGYLIKIGLFKNKDY